MEIIEPAASPQQHRWLKWMGIQPPPVEADSWVPVVRGCRHDLPDGASSQAQRLVAVLGDAGIMASQRSYDVDTSHFDPSLAGFRSRGRVVGGLEHHVAVLVHDRDFARAHQLALQLEQTLKQETTVPAVSDEELTREALEAKPASEPD